MSRRGRVKECFPSFISRLCVCHDYLYRCCFVCALDPDCNCECVGSDCLGKVARRGRQTSISLTRAFGKLINVRLHVVKPPPLQKKLGEPRQRFAGPAPACTNNQPIDEGARRLRSGRCRSA